MITFDQNDEGQALSRQRAQAILKPMLHCKHETQYCSREGILSHRKPKEIFFRFSVSRPLCQGGRSWNSIEKWKLSYGVA